MGWGFNDRLLPDVQKSFILSFDLTHFSRGAYGPERKWMAIEKGFNEQLLKMVLVVMLFSVLTIFRVLGKMCPTQS